MPTTTFKIKNYEISSLIDFLQVLVKDKSILEYKNLSGNDVYQLSSYYGNLEIMKYLEKEHNWNIHVKDNYGNDAYIFSSCGGPLSPFSFLT